MSTNATSSQTPVGHRRVWMLALPIIVSNLSVPLVGIVDTAVVGRLGDPAYIGAIALGALIFSFLYWGFGFLRMGTTGVAAQAFGRGDTHALITLTARGLIIASAIGVAIIALQKPLLSLALGILDGGQTLESLTATYYGIRVFSAPAVLITYVVLGILIGLQRTGMALVVQIVLNVTNVVLDIVFVVGFDMDVDGVAWASVISEYLAMFLGLAVLWRYIEGRIFGLSIRELLDRHEMAHLMFINGNLFLRNLSLIISHSWFTAKATQLGDVPLAANSVLIHMVHFLAHGLDGFAHAAEALVGEAYGKKSGEQFRQTVMITTQWALVTAIVGSGIFWFAGDWFVGLMTTSDAVREFASEYLIWVVVMPAIAVWSYQLDGIYVGTTHSKEMRDGMLISFVVFALGMWTLVPAMGNHGLWMTLLAFTAMRGITLAYWFPRVRLHVTSRSDP